MARRPGQLPAAGVSERVPMAGAPQALTRLVRRATVGKLVELP